MERLILADAGFMLTDGLVFILTFLYYPFLLGLYYASQCHLKFEDILFFVWGVTMFFKPMGLDRFGLVGSLFTYAKVLYNPRNGRQ
ncbi:hypothetical protein A3860_39110 [Niastella vici]|uniref:Uncharacterized protein n=1 Tax=Niastella vici TaxID=1703345 RepID=A0A1V9FKR1_9BACT|nr:hypothetical protein A3860_39110 [Niastella vici]